MCKKNPTDLRPEIQDVSGYTTFISSLVSCVFDSQPQHYTAADGRVCLKSSPCSFIVVVLIRPWFQSLWIKGHTVPEGSWGNFPQFSILSCCSSTHSSPFKPRMQTQDPNHLPEGVYSLSFSYPLWSIGQVCCHIPQNKGVVDCFFRSHAVTTCDFYFVFTCEIYLFIYFCYVLLFPEYKQISNQTHRAGSGSGSGYSKYGIIHHNDCTTHFF